MQQVLNGFRLDQQNGVIRSVHSYFTLVLHISRWGGGGGSSSETTLFSLTADLHCRLQPSFSPSAPVLRPDLNWSL